MRWEERERGRQRISEREIGVDGNRGGTVISAGHCEERFMAH